MIEIAEQSEIRDIQSQINAIYEHLRVYPICVPTTNGIIHKLQALPFPKGPWGNFDREEAKKVMGREIRQAENSSQNTV